MTEFFPYFVATLAFAALIFALHRRSVNEEMRADYRLRTQTRTERAELEALIEEIRQGEHRARGRLEKTLENLAETQASSNAKITEEFRDNDQKLQNRIATVENILSSRKFG